MKVCLGGTFDPFHIGHEALLRRAIEGAEALFVGVTVDSLATRPGRTVAPWEERARAVREFVAAQGFKGDLTVSRLDDATGPAASGDFDAIVVSPETVAGADAINAQRRKTDLPSLQVLVVPHVLAQDLLPVSATRIHAGDIDRDGRRLSAVRVAAGSANPVKVAAIEEEVARILGLPIAIKASPVESGVPEQPKQEEARAGARNRADAALTVWPETDYAIGVEAGMCQDPGGNAWYDAQACVVVDRDGLVTDGWGPAFQYPAWVTERALRGEMVSDILGPVADDPRIGGTTGAIGFLTDGRMDRTELTRIAVLMAFVPRIRRDLYAAGSGSEASASSRSDQPEP